MYRTIADIQGAIQSGTSAVSIVEESLSRIASEKELNAFVEVFSDSAMATAQKVDKKIEQGTAGKLAGVILGIKDNICYKGHKVSACLHAALCEGFWYWFACVNDDALLNRDVDWLDYLLTSILGTGYSSRCSSTLYIQHVISVICVRTGLLLLALQ
jgi:aspartyl-tRNA(Asn)/glutamyl-tRNA(Gln) amidotransferase subunit A